MHAGGGPLLPDEIPASIDGSAPLVPNPKPIEDSENE